MNTHCIHLNELTENIIDILEIPRRGNEIAILSYKMSIAIS